VAWTRGVVPPSDERGACEATPPQVAVLPANSVVALRLEPAVDLREVLAAKEARAVSQCRASPSRRRMRGLQHEMVSAGDESFLTLGVATPEAEDDP
jgi:hypothetical protein